MTNKFSCFLTQKGRWLTATLFLLFSLGIGNMWGTETYTLVDSNGDLTGDFYATNTGTDVDVTIDGKKFTKAYSMGSSLSAPGNYLNQGGNKSIEYDCKSSAVTFNIYCNNGKWTVSKLEEDATNFVQVQAESSSSSTNRKITVNVTGLTKKTRFFFFAQSSTGTVYQIEAIESGTHFPQVGEVGFGVSLVDTRFANYSSSNKKGYIDGLYIVNTKDCKYKNNSNSPVIKTAGTDYVQFVPKNNTKVKVKFSTSGKLFLNTSNNTTEATELTSKNEYNVTGGTTYYLVPNGKDVTIDSIWFVSATPAATYDATFANGGHGTAPANASSVSSVTLTQIIGVSGWRHTGWTANVATKVGTTDKAAGDALAIGATVTLLQNTTFTAVWAQEFGVSYNANGASGDAPTNSNKYIAGEKFNVAGAGTMVAPTNKAFGGWQYSTTTYAENDEFTMPAADVEFMAVWNTSYTVTYVAHNGTAEDNVVENNPATIASCSFTAPANKTFKEWTTHEDGTGDKYAPGAAVSTTLTLYAQWKNAPQTIFHWRYDGSTTALNSEIAAVSGGKVTLKSTDTNDFSQDTPGYNANVPDDMKSAGSKTLKSGKSAHYIEIECTSNFAEGDTVAITAYGNKDNAGITGWKVSSTSSNTGDIATQTPAGNGASDFQLGKVVIPEGFVANNKLYLNRAAGTGTGIAAIKVVRPAGVKPTVTFSSNKSEMYTNETATLTFDSENTNSVTYTIKKDNAVTTDASITGTTFAATVAGEYEIIATQASDGDFWAVEKSITITVNATIPVSSVTVAGAATGYIGNATFLTATAEYATQYRWYVDGTVQTGEEAATFAFTPTEAKTYSIVCEAKNQFNSDWIASTAHSITGSHLYGEIIRATLTDGTHATVTGLVGGTADPNLTQSNKKMDNDKYFGVQLAAGAAFKEGDTVIIAMTTAGANYPCLFEDKDRTNVLYLATEGSSALEYKFVLPAAATGITTVYISRHDDDYKWNPVVSYMSVVRPKAKKSTVESLTAVTVNSTAITAGELTTLLANREVEVATAYPGAPEVVFTKHTVITYVDDSNKAEDTPINVTAVLNGTKWEASTTINATSYTVKAAKLNSAKVYYYDGATKLGEETVAINGSPIHAGDYDDKNLATFDAWYSNADLAEGHKIADMTAVTVSKDTTFYAKWNYQYASSVNVEGWVLENGKGVSDAQKETQTGALVSLLGTRKFASNIAYDKGNIELDSLNDDPSKTNRNYAYLGLKVKKSGKMLDFRLAKDSYVKVKFGNVAATPKVSINGADYADMSLTDGVYSYTATGNDYVSIKTASDGALVFKQIMINEDLQAVALPYLVTYDANGGTCATESAAGASVTLPAVTAPADYTFTGWYNGDTKVGNAGQPYVPTSNITLQAHFAPVEYAIAYDGNGETSGSMSAGVAGWGTLVTPDANAFVKTGHVFSGWVITKTSDGSATGITFSEGKFEMPKYDVTLVAQWDDVSKVVKIVETDAKYETFAAAIAAVGAGQTIQLLQSCEYDTYWDLAVAGTVTLDLNGHDLTYTGAKRGVQVESGAKLVLMDGTATVAPTIDLTANPMSRSAITYTSGTFDSKDGMCALAGGEIEINSGRYLATEGVILVKGQDATATVNDGVLICRDNSVIGGNGTNSADYRNYVMNIHGGILYGEIFSAGYASMVVYHPNVGSLNIDGGILVSTNGPCVVTRGGATNITGGTLVAIGDGTGKCGDASLVLPAVGIAADFKSAYPGVASTDVAISGTVDVTGEAGAVQAVYAGATPSAAEVEAIGVSGGTFNTVLSNAVCAEGYVPVTTPNAQGKYTVEPKDGTEIIGVVVTGNTEGTVSGLYKGTASIKLNSKKLDNGDYYIYVTLKEGYTFEENDVLIVDVNGKSDLSGGNKALEITTGVGNIDGAVWKSIAVDDYSTGENTISLAGIAAGQTSIGLKRSTNQNAKINGLRVLRPMNPVLKKVTVATVEGTPDNTNHVAIEVPFTTADDALDAIAYEWVSNSDAWTAAHAPAVANTWAWGVENTVTLTDKDGDASVYYVTISKAVPSSDATLATLTYGTPATAIALADGIFEYNVELPYGTSDVPTLAATVHHAGANVTDIDDAAAFVNRHATSTVTVTAENGTTTQDYTVNFTVSRFESKVLWDGSTMSALSDITAAATAAGVAVTTTGISVTSFSAKTCEENGKSYTRALDFGGKTQSTRNFGIVIPAGKVAKVSVVYRAKGTSRSIMVATALSDAVNESTITSVEAVDGSNLYIMTADMFGGGTLYINTMDGFHVHEISLQLADGFARSSMLGNGVLGTICVPNNVAIEDIQGVTVYELMGRDNNNYGKLAFDEIVSGELEAGAPYVFMANGNHMALLYGATHVANPVDKGNGMYGTFEDVTFSVGDADDIYFFRDHALWAAKETGVKILANRAYVKLSEIDYLTNPNPAPGRRRITMTVNGEQVATDIENLEASEQPVKLMINGQIFILRGEKLYDATGRLVK